MQGQEIAQVAEEVNLLENVTLSPIQDDIRRAAERTIVACCGRRVGKTRVGPVVVGQWMHEDLEELAEEVRAGRRGRWAGEGLPKGDAKFIEPDVLYWCIAPRERHLDSMRGNLRQLYLGDAACFLHPQFPSFYDRGHQLWVWHPDGVCGRYDFVAASGEAALVSKGLRGAWIDEAGFVPNERYNAFRPQLWEHGGRLFASGTPSLGDAHWFTKTAVSGLPPGHERADPSIAEYDPTVRTFIASTVEHAFLEEARRQALVEARFQGELWAAQWIYADWRAKGRQIYREWRDEVHWLEYGLRRGGWYLGDQALPAPDCVYGLVDWSGGVAPGAAVVFHVWQDTPLEQEDPRPLVVATEDYQGHDAYTDHGWWRVLGDLERRWGVDEWIGDPHSPALVKAARRAGFNMAPGAHQDKMGRISLVAGLLHHDKYALPPVRPAFYASRTCTELPRQAASYRWRVTRQGEVTNKPKQHDDHCLDCLAMLVSEIDTGGVQIGGVIWN